MRYLRLRLSRPDGSTIFETDLLVDRFEPLMREMVSLLVQQKVLREGESYNARIIPRSEDQPSYDRPIVLKSGQVADNGQGILDIMFDNGDTPAQVRYLTLQIRSLEKEIVYRFDWRLDALLGTLLIEIAQFLLDSGTLTPGDRFHLNLSAHDGGRPRLDPLAIAKPAKASVVVPKGQRGTIQIDVRAQPALGAGGGEDPDLEIVVESVEDLIKPQPRPLNDLAGAEAVDRVSDRDLPIYVRHGAMERARKAAGVSKRVDEEVGGFLIGNVFRDPQTERLFVEIVDVVEADQARGTYVSIDFDYNTWRTVLDRIAKEHPDKILIGWYHTHLVSQAVVLPLDEHTQEYAVLYQPFFSQADLFIQRNFFPDPWYVALVMDLRCQKDVFFGWRDGQVAHIGGYYLHGE